jgi:hypothetical protein
MNKAIVGCAGIFEGQTPALAGTPFQKGAFI